MTNVVQLNTNQNSWDDMAFIGVGGCGSNIVEFFAGRLPEAVCKVVVNNDKPSLNKLDLLVHKVALDGDYIKKSAAETMMGKHLFELENKLDQSNTICLIAGLGGRTGSWITPMLLQKLKGQGKRVIVIAVEPFNFESPRQDLIVEALEELASADVLMLCSNQRAIAELESGSSVSTLFAEMNARIYESLNMLRSGRSKGASWLTLTFNN